MKTLLCIDSSTVKASVALFKNGVFFGEDTSLQQRSHSEFVTKAIEDLLKRASLDLRELNAVALTNGPGSFTGIRVSVGIAKTLCFATGVNLWVADTLSVIRSQAAVEKFCFASLNAYKNLVFGSLFLPSQKAAQPQVFTYEAAAELIRGLATSDAVQLIGEGSSLFVSLLDRSRYQVVGDPYPSAKMLGDLYFADPEVGQTIDWKMLNPLYIRGSEAEENLRIRSSEKK